MEARLARYKQMRERLGDLEIRRIAEN